MDLLCHLSKYGVGFGAWMLRLAASCYAIVNHVDVPGQVLKLPTQPLYAGNLGNLWAANDNRYLV